MFTSSALKNLRSTLKDYASNVSWALKFTWESSSWWLTSLTLLTILGSVFPAAAAWAGRQLINVVVEMISGGAADGITPALPWLITIFGLTLLTELFMIASKYSEFMLSNALMLSVNMSILDHSAKLDLAQLETPEMQNVVDRARQDTFVFFTKFVTDVVSTTGLLLQTLALAGVLIVIDPLIVILLFPLILPFIVVRTLIARKEFNQQYSRATKRRWSNYFITLLSQRELAGEAKILGLAPLIRTNYRKLVREFIKEDKEIQLLTVLANTSFAIIYLLIFYFLFTRIITQVTASALTVGDIALFTGATNRLRNNLSLITVGTSRSAQNVLYIRNMRELLDVTPHIQDSPDTTSLPPENARGELVLQDVTFSYPGSRQPAVDEVSLSIKAGETVAIVGENGAGKSTLVKLIARLYEADGGAIYLDGHDIAHISLDSLRSQIAFVFQRFNQYEATLGENISYGNWIYNWTPEAIRLLGHQTGLNELASTLENGYDTFVGRLFGNYDLSGGNWQKVAIARAFARHQASLIILDEPTASLDAKAEYQIYSHFKNLVKDRTAILISHRFSTVRLADRIIVMAEGRVVEQGTHAELVNMQGLYASLYRAHEAQLPE